MQEDCLLYNIALRWSIPKTLCDEQKRPSELSEQVVGKKFIHLKEERFRKCSPSLQYISYLYFNRKNIILIDLSRNRPPKPVTKELHHKSRAACRPCVHTIKRLKYPVNIHRSAIWKCIENAERYSQIRRLISLSSSAVSILFIAHLLNFMFVVIIAYKISRRTDTRLVLDTFESALKNRHYPQNVIFH